MLGVCYTFICRECGRKKPGNYFISETLCKKCAAKRRGKIDNPVVTVGEGVIATTVVLNRLRRKAESQVPYTWRDELARATPWLSFATLWYLAYQFGDPIRRLIPKEHDLAIFAAWMLWYFFLPALSGVFLSLKLSKPRDAVVQARTAELAQQRKAELEEAERFYGSPEWTALRQLVLTEEGINCSACRRRIKRQSDVTVDHRLPRSRYPHLALDRSNLQVLCRRCNSKKGTR